MRHETTFLLLTTVLLGLLCSAVSAGERLTPGRAEQADPSLWRNMAWWRPVIRWRRRSAWMS